ncbi:hypothetical protein DFH06DRAFT_1229042 [Mycena polygramma]|nr:hypothetical protein DFH06DRAFT_1229042 [Mycena polygramma]
MAQDSRRVRIAEIKLEITRLQAELDSLTESLTFPILTLPVEITSQIFVYCLPDSDDARDVSPLDAPLVLGRVCSTWRNIALSTPQLWTFLSLSIDRNAYSPTLFSALKQWLLRSRNFPLSIRLHHPTCASEDVTEEDENWWEHTNDYIYHAVPILLTHYRRWEDVEFNMPVSYLRALVSDSSKPTEELPFLRHLTLGSSQEDWAGPDSLENPVTIFMNAPRLWSVHLILEQNELQLMDQVHLPWEQLTSFTGTAFSAHDCLVVLNQAPSLIDCVFHITDSRSDEPLVHPPPLVHLKSLRLESAVERARTLDIIRRTTLPALESLVLGRVSHTTSMVLALLIERSECTLRHLSCIFPTILDCLDDMPQLSTLELLDYTQYQLVKVIQYMKTAHVYVPYLESLTISCRREGVEGDFPFMTLLVLLQTLCNEGRAAPLRRFRLVWTTSLLPCKPDAQEVQAFKTLREIGVDVYVGTQGESWV